MFNLSDNITLPKIGDYINTSHMPPDIFGIFTSIWIQAFGGWFFAFIFGIIGAALYIKYDNPVVPVVFFIIMVILFGDVINATMPGVPSANIFVIFIGLIAAFTVGFMLYQLFVSKEE